MLLSRQATARLPARAAVPAGPSRAARGSAVAPLAAAVAAPPASLDVKSFKDGSSAGGTATLALSVAEADTAGAVVHRYIVLLRQNARAGTASTLTRSEVQGGGKKPYAQKGTGNARQGSRRTPLRPGGGITFGPKPRDWGIKMNKKERRLAMATALQSAAGDTMVVDAVSLASPKTSELVAALARLGADPMAPGAHILLVVEAVSRELAMAARNVAGLTLARVGALNAYDVLRADRIVLEKGALASIQDFYGPKVDDE